MPQQSAATAVLGVIGKPVAQSKSPALHNPCLGAAGVDACYVPLLVEDIAAFLASPLFGGPSFQGFSVTIPHKEVGDPASCGATAYTTVQTLVHRGSAFCMSVPEAHRPSQLIKWALCSFTVACRPLTCSALCV